MRIRRLLRGSALMGGITLFLVAVVALLPTPARAQCPTTAVTPDSDGDGFSDPEEACGIALLDGSGVSMNPNTKDLFIIVVPATPSFLPTDPAGPAEFISNPQDQGGLGIITHLIDAAQVGTNRLVGLTQKAVSVTESPSTNGDVAGECPWGTANDLLAFCVVYTKKIEEYVTSVYAAQGQTAPSDVINNYKKHTFAHETMHGAARLTRDSNSRFGGHHYKSGSNAIHDQSVIYTVKGGVVRFIIGTSFTDADKGDATLK